MRGGTRDPKLQRVYVTQNYNITNITLHAMSLYKLVRPWWKLGLNTDPPLAKPARILLRYMPTGKTQCGAYIIARWKICTVCMDMNRALGGRG